MSNILDTLKNIVYRVAIYIRLSREDIDKHEESLSVINQKSVLTTYVNEQGYELIDIYIDEGFTGTNFDRPAFKKMIEDIELGKINMVITKDLSRLGRDYIETGEYIEKYFPLHNIRYVALLDGIDTFLDSSSNDIAPFKAVINDMYSRDNSKKIRTALRTMQLKGKWVGGCTPFGYMVDPKDKNHLVPCPEEALIVKNIFKLAKEGLSYYQIAEKLTSEHVPTSSMIRKTKRKGKYAIKGYWNTKTVRCILSNRLYLGDMVQNRNQRISYKIRKIVKNEESRWIIVENTHEPIIDRDTFNEIQRILSNSKIRTDKKIFRLLDGLLYCYECKNKISICKPRKSDNRTYIVCNYYRRFSKTHLCTSHSFNYDILEEKILKEIKKMFERYLDFDNLKQKVKEELDKHNGYQKNQLIEVDDLIKNKLDNLDKIYFDKLDSIITFEMFERVSKKLKVEIEKLKMKRKSLLQILNQKEENMDNEKECENIIKEFLSLENPSRSLILKLINRIEIHKDKTIDIYFNFIKNHH